MDTALFTRKDLGSAKIGYAMMRRKLEKGDLVYVAGPYCPSGAGNNPQASGITLHNAIRISYQNTKKAIHMGIRLLKLGYIPLIPHLSHFIHQEMDEDLGEEWYKIDYKYLDVCSAIVMLDGWQQSFGATRERHRALIQNKIVITEKHIEKMEKSK